MKKNYNKGFTLIELLVVIAIIGILASVILASLNSARAKGADAAIKSGMENARAQAELFYDNHASSYANVCALPATSPDGINTILQQAATTASSGTLIVTATAETASGAGSAVCHSTAVDYVTQMPLKTAGYWCVDSTGVVKAEAAILPAAAIKCV